MMMKQLNRVRMMVLALVAIFLMAAFVACTPADNPSTGGGTNLEASSGSSGVSQVPGSSGNGGAVTPSGSESTAPSGSESTAPSGSIPDGTEPSGSIPGSTAGTTPSGTTSTAPGGTTSTAPSTAPVTPPAPTTGGNDGPSGGDETHTHEYKFAEQHYPTCQVGGYTLYRCDCGASYKENEVPAVDHNYVATVVAPTYEAGGYTLHECFMCHDSYKDTYTDKLEAPEIQGHTHSYTEEVIPATCTEEGYTLHACSCGLSYKDNFLPARGTHRCTVTYTAPTCTETGSNFYDCPDCDYTRTEVVAATGHSYGDWVITKEPTETQQGEKERTCGTCGHVDAMVVPATSEVREHYIDPTMTSTVNWNGCRIYKGDRLKVYDYRTWDSTISIRLNANGGYDIVYYKQDGTKVEYTLEPMTGYSRSFDVLEDGTFRVRDIEIYG